MKLGPNQQAWIAWLRDPSNKQTTGILQRIVPYDSHPIGHCCLGGACEVADSLKLPGVKINRSVGLNGDDLDDQIGVQDSFALFSEEGSPRLVSDLYQSAMDYINDLEGRQSDVNRCDLQLVNLNDLTRLTFPQIADVLETFPDLYFSESK